MTVDAIVTKETENKLNEILLITRLRPPYQGHLAFPGGFVDYGEDPVDAVNRELKEETNLEAITEPELITVRGDPARDPRKHIVTIAYYVQVDKHAQVKAGDDAETANWYDLKAIYNDSEKYKLAFDHRSIL